MRLKSVADWPYNTDAWQRLRAAKLQASPLCEPCKRRGRLISPSHVDHVVSIASGGDPLPTLDGLMSMCAGCHSIKTNAKDRAGGKGVAFKGCDVDGLPLDPEHPFMGGNPLSGRQAGAPGPVWQSKIHLVSNRRGF